MAERPIVHEAIYQNIRTLFISQSFVLKTIVQKMVCTFIFHLYDFIHSIDQYVFAILCMSSWFLGFGLK